MIVRIFAVLVFLCASSFSTGCVFVAGDSNPFVMGIGSLRVTSAGWPDDEGALAEATENRAVAVDTQIATPLLYLGYSNSLSGIVVGPSKLRTTSIYVLREPIEGERISNTSLKRGPFLFHLGQRKPPGAERVATRDWLGSVGAKIVRQRDTLSLGVGYQCRMVGSGIAEDRSWGYALYDEEPWIQIITTRTSVETLKGVTLNERKD
ncbi:hypothetical protein KQI84_04125 [bacterium]|nr:hypothetical protein [bacterium]